MSACIKKIFASLAALLLVALITVSANAFFDDMMASQITASSGPAPSSGPCGAANNADAVSVGFTSQVFCNDFTAAIPNVNGTGLPANWLNCVGSSAAVAGNVWFMTTNPGGGTTINCANQITQLTDTNGGGNKALRVRLLPGQLVNGNSNDSITQLISVAGDYPNFTNRNNLNTWAHGYFEWTFRVETSHGQGWAGDPGNNIAFWADSTALPRLEPDWFETIFGCCDTTVTAHSTGNNIGLPFYSLDMSTYHTLGVLYTADVGATTAAICLYIDSVFQQCAEGSFSGGTSVAQQRVYSLLWNGINCNANTQDQTCQLPTPTFSFIDVWVKSFRIYACPGSSAGDACLTPSAFVRSSPGIACAQGPNTAFPTGALGTDLTTAGFTTCALNADFTDTSSAHVNDGNGGTTWVMNNTATWLSQCGATTPWRFHLKLSTNYVNQDGADAACGKAVITTDPLLGGQVLHIQFTPADRSGSLVVFHFSWPGCGDPCTANGPWLPAEMYEEITMRFASTSQPGGGGIFWSQDQELTSSTPFSGTNGWIDWSNLEALSNGQLYSASSLDDEPARNNGDPSGCCVGFGFDGTLLDLTHYHTWGFLHTSDESTLMNLCVYRDGILVPPAIGAGSGPTNQNCSTHAPWTNSNTPTPPPPLPSSNDIKWNDAGYVRYVDWIGQATGTVTANIDQYIKSIRIFACSGYKTNTSRGPHCPGPLISRIAPPQ